MQSSNEAPETFPPVPAYSLYGETERSVPPMHLERIADRAPSNGWRIALHRHPALTQFLIVKNGSFEATLGAVSQQLSGPALVGVPAGEAHAFNFEENTSGFVLSLRDAVAEAHPGDGLTVLDAPVSGICSTDAGDACEHLHRILARTDQGHSELRDALVAQIKAHARIVFEESGASAGRSSGHTLVRQFQKSIEQQLSFRWSVAQHAEALCVTSTHLNRVVKKATGMTASQRIAQATMERAKALLMHTNRSVAEVAFALGYDDPPHFSRRFRSWTGHAPRDWRLIDFQH